MPIQILPARLANQIAAGEVVERPASVVKELIENSLDAGATRIDIDIEKGGSRLIRIRDNGTGITKDELGLALSRHATSKISSLDDLEAIVSLGFRGEALASISSVSRLTLTSRTEDQAEAWSAYAEGRDMEVQLKPAAHPVGTTLEVLDLFFNTPARRKFLRSEKTEFNHIDELIKRIALSRFDVAITLHHNGKLIRQYRTAQTQIQQERRLASACGQPFLQHALAVDLAYGDLKLSGWICSPQGARSQNDIQYCYVNGRMMKDKLINHAIRQAYESSLRSDQYAAYVLYIVIDPHQVDVNVHPAKHEVRFHQARLVHDFIYQALQSALQQGALAEEEYHYDTPSRASAHADVSSLEVSNSALQAIANTPDYPNKQSSNEWLPQQPTTNGSVEEKSVKNSSYYDGFSVDSGDKNAPKSYRDKTGSKDEDFSGPTAAEIAAYQKLIQTQDQEQPQVVEPQPFHQPDYGQSKETQKEWQRTAPVAGRATGLGKALCLVEQRYLMMERQDDVVLLSLDKAEQLRQVGQFQLAKAEGLKPQPLLIPVSVPVDSTLIASAEQHTKLLQKLGIQLKVKGQSGIIIMAVCLPLRQQNLQQLIPNLLTHLLAISEDQDAQDWDNLFYWLAEQCSTLTAKYSFSQAIQLVTELEQLWDGKLVQFYGQLIRQVDLQAAIEAFK